MLDGEEMAGCHLGSGHVLGVTKPFHREKPQHLASAVRKPLLGAACDDVLPSSELCQGTEIQGEHVQQGEEQAATSRGQPEPRWLCAGILGPPLPCAVATSDFFGWLVSSLKESLLQPCDSTTAFWTSPQSKFLGGAG